MAYSNKRLHHRQSALHQPHISSDSLPVWEFCPAIRRTHRATVEQRDKSVHLQLELVHSNPAPLLQKPNGNMVPTQTKWSIKFRIKSFQIEDFSFENAITITSIFWIERPTCRKTGPTSVQYLVSSDPPWRSTKELVFALGFLRRRSTNRFLLTANSSTGTLSVCSPRE